MKIIKFPTKNAAVNPDVVLEEAMGKLNSVILIGWNKDGTLDFRASLDLTHAHVLWLMQVAQHKLLNGDYSS
jgi:ethanolamine utilization cobalamin adenosyltransferase